IFIQGVLFFGCDQISAVDLSPTGDPGPNGKSYPNARRLIDGEQRTRPYDRHVSAQDIEELRNLVQPRASQERAQARKSSRFIRPLAMTIAWSQQRPKFENKKGCTVLSHPPLPEDDRRTDPHAHRKANRGH